MNRARSGAAGALLGAIPGAVLVLLAAPVTGETELTLGVAGFFIGFLGLVIGAMVGARRPERR